MKKVLLIIFIFSYLKATSANAESLDDYYDLILNKIKSIEIPFTKQYFNCKFVSSEGVSDLVNTFDHSNKSIEDQIFVIDKLRQITFIGGAKNKYINKISYDKGRIISGYSTDDPKIYSTIKFNRLNNKVEWYLYDKNLNESPEYSILFKCNPN